MTKTLSFLLLLSLSINNLLAQDLSILLVHDNANDLTRIDSIKKAIIVAGYQYDLFDAVDHKKSPSYDILSKYELVVWYTGNDGGSLYLWNGNDTENENLKTYLDKGGMLWLQGLDFLYDKYGVAPDVFGTGSFVYDYLGIKKYAAQSHVGDVVYDGVPQLDVVSSNDICQTGPLKWSYPTLHYVDGCELTENAAPIYKMGPAGYDYDQYYAGFYNENENFKILTFTFETARFKSPASLYTEPLFREVLDYFNQFANAIPVDVSNITISSEKGDVEITERGGTLQLIAEVLPENAKNKQLTWSIDVASTASASIDATGLLIASGTNDGNGTVWVTATSKDNDSIIDTYEITITNQGE
ncbi:MAG: Ig-like domain-containing protein [Bacteroidota bacterium]